jgi:hypothetical protein
MMDSPLSKTAVVTREVDRDSNSIEGLSNQSDGTGAAEGVEHDRG